MLQRFYGRFVRPKRGQEGIGDVLKRLPGFYSKIGASLKSPSNGGGLIGQPFEEDGTNWKVHDVSWSEESEPAQVVVHYYDYDLATSEGTDEAGL